MTAYETSRDAEPAAFPGSMPPEACAGESPVPGLRREIVRVPHLAAFGTTVQASEIALRELSIDYFLLILVRRGKRYVRRGANLCVAGPGEAILLTPGMYDVLSTLDGADAYRSDWLAWDISLAIPREGSPCAQLPPVDGARRLNSVDELLEQSLAAARRALELRTQLPLSIVRHRVLEVPVWLREQGFHLASAGSKPLGEQIRAMVAEDASADWSAPSLAAFFSMSEATLRRRLSVEGTSVQQAVSEARMAYAMGLLQSTDLSISRVALDCGYASASRFATRFRARFGYAPSELRSAAPQTVDVRRRLMKKNVKTHEPFDFLNAKLSADCLNSQTTSLGLFGRSRL